MVQLPNKKRILLSTEINASDAICYYNILKESFFIESTLFKIYSKFPFNWCSLYYVFRFMKMLLRKVVEAEAFLLWWHFRKWFNIFEISFFFFCCCSNEITFFSIFYKESVLEWSTMLHKPNVCRQMLLYSIKARS